MASSSATSNDPPRDAASVLYEKLRTFGEGYRSLAATVQTYQDDSMTHVCATKTLVYCLTHIPDDMDQLRKAKEYLARAKAKRVETGLRLYNRVMEPGAVPQELTRDWMFLTLVAELELFMQHDE